jgi:hypothetical protein
VDDEVSVTDIVTRLRRWTHAVDAAPASDLMDEAADEIENLRQAIRRLAEQDATLSVCDGAVQVTMDGTLTDGEREAVCQACDEGRWYPNDYHYIHTLRGLLERMK